MRSRSDRFKSTIKIMNSFAQWHNNELNSLDRDYSLSVCDGFVLNYVLTPSIDIKKESYKFINTYFDCKNNIEIKTSIDEKSNLVFSVSRYGVNYV